MKYYPKHAVWEMTLACNMHCKHCGSRGGKARENELTKSECMNVAQQLIDMGNEMITLIGGEIFLVPFWYEVAKKFIDNGVKANLITNAYMIGDKQIDEIKKSGIHDLGISIDGLENTHNKIRGRKDSFEKAFKAMDRLRKEGIYVSVVTTVTKWNFPELEELYKLLKEHDVWLWQIQLATPMGNCSDQEDFLISVEDVPKIIDFIKSKRATRSSPIVVAGDDIGYLNCENIRSTCYDKDGEFMGCAAGLLNVGIDSVGNVKGCESLYSDDFIEGNLRENTLQEIWTKEGAFSYNRDFKPEMLQGVCADCEKGKICAAGCRSMNYFSSGEKYNNMYCVRNLCKN